MRKAIITVCETAIDLGSVPSHRSRVANPLEPFIFSRMTQREQHVLSCKGLSLFSTINSFNSWTRILVPPPVAQFIKDVDIKACSGEVYGITGAPGSGKTTLLEAVSCRGSGDVTGSLQLNHNLLTRERFDNLCSYVHRDQYLLPLLPVRFLLHHQARLHLGGTTTMLEIKRRVTKVMTELEIIQYAQKPPSQMSKSARRRVLIALNLVKDPMLIVLDDILEDLDCLAAYHVLSCLSTYAKKNNRIVLLSLKNPRSDLYHLLDKITILFYGEVFYSGRTKDLPGYFQEAGFPCPMTENPVMYYLTLSTIDRETPDRFTETQEQAIALVANFKALNQSLAVEEFHPNRQSYGIGSTVALCYFEKPSRLKKLGVLIRRNFEIMATMKWQLLGVCITIFLLTFFITMFVNNFTTGDRAGPHAMRGLYSILLLLHSTLTIFLASSFYSPILRLLFQEYNQNVYNQSLPLMAFLLYNLPVIMLISSLSSTTFLWRLGLFTWSTFTSLGMLLLVVGLVSQTVVLSIMLVVRDECSAITGSLTVVTVLFALSGSLLRSVSSLSASWLFIVMVTNPFTYIGHLLSFVIISDLPLKNCTISNRLDIDPSPPHSFCRWNSGEDVHLERYPDGFSADTSIIYLLLIVTVFYTLLFIVHAVKKPIFLVKKFI